MLYKNVDKLFSNKNKNSLQKVKNLLKLRAEIYKKNDLWRKNLKFEERIGERVKLKNQSVNLPATSEEKEFNDLFTTD